MPKEVKLSNHEALKAEIRAILGRRPMMQAEDVVEFARDHEDSAIRKAFDAQELFDDEAAAEKARLAFARHLIQRVKVRLITANKSTTPLRVYVNLRDERKTEAGGYRLRSAVLRDEERLDMLRREFAGDIETIIRRFADILEAEHEETLRGIAAQVAGISHKPREAHVGEALQALMRGERRKR